MPDAFEIALGQNPKYRSIYKFGHTLAVSTVRSGIGMAPAVQHYWPAAAESVEAVSSSGDDDSGGTGAQQIIVQGLDGNWNPCVQLVTLNGITPVSLTGTFQRVFRAYVVRVGTYHGTNVGNITLRKASAGATHLNILAANGQSNMCQFTIPEGFIGMLVHFSASVSALSTNKDADVWLMTYTNADQAAGATVVNDLALFGDGEGGGSRLQRFFPGVKEQFNETPPHHGILAPKTDIWVDAASSSGVADVSAAFQVILAPRP